MRDVVADDPQGKGGHRANLRILITGGFHQCLIDLRFVRRLGHRHVRGEHGQAFERGRPTAISLGRMRRGGFQQGRDGLGNREFASSTEVDVRILLLFTLVGLFQFVGQQRSPGPGPASDRRVQVGVALVIQNVGQAGRGLPAPCYSSRAATYFVGSEPICASQLKSSHTRTMMMTITAGTTNNCKMNRRWGARPAAGRGPAGRVNSKRLRIEPCRVPRAPKPKN